MQITVAFGTLQGLQLGAAQPKFGSFLGTHIVPQSFSATLQPPDPAVPALPDWPALPALPTLPPLPTPPPTPPVLPPTPTLPVPPVLGRAPLPALPPAATGSGEWN